MSTPYAGNAASYPANVSLPDDGEPAAARIFATPYQQLADRTAWLAAGLTTEATTRAADIAAEASTRAADDATEAAARAAADAAEATTRAADDAAEATARAAADTAIVDYIKRDCFTNFRVGSISAAISRAQWNPLFQRWYATGGPLGGTDAIKQSSDGVVWVADTVPILGQTWVDLDVNPTTGEMLATTDNIGTSAIAYTLGTGWATNTIGATLTSPRWNPVLGSWVVVGRGTVPYCYALLGATAAGAFAGPYNLNLPNTGGTGNPRIAVNKTSGRMIAHQANNVNGIAYSYSDDGVTWNYVGVVVPSFGGGPSSTAASLAYSQAEGRWIMTIGETTGGSFDVFESTDDGLTFTFVVNVSVGAVRGGGLIVVDTPYLTAWVAYAFQSLSTFRRPGIHVSIDGGATWKYYGNGYEGITSTGRATPHLASDGKGSILATVVDVANRSLVSSGYGDRGV